MDKWRHAFVDGEFAPREKILAGLTLEQVTRRPSPGSHTIYEELWHAARWQNIVVWRDEGLYSEWERGEVYPRTGPADEAEWVALVADFFKGVERALWWAESPDRLAHETDPGVTMADALQSLAVHTSYHMGKIVALRQLMGAWGEGARGRGLD